MPPSAPQKLALGIGGFILAAPHAFHAGHGIVPSPDPSLMSELRAPGAALAALGGIMLAGLLRARWTPVALTVYLAFPAGRLVSLAIDGMPSGSVAGALVIELFVSALCHAAFRPGGAAAASGACHDVQSARRGGPVRGTTGRTRANPLAAMVAHSTRPRSFGTSHRRRSCASPRPSRASSTGCQCRHAVAGPPLHASTGWRPCRPPPAPRSPSPPAPPGGRELGGLAVHARHDVPMGGLHDRCTVCPETGGKAEHGDHPCLHRIMAEDSALAVAEARLAAMAEGVGMPNSGCGRCLALTETATRLPPGRVAGGESCPGAIDPARAATSGPGSGR